MKIVNVHLETKNNRSMWIGPDICPDFQENVISLQLKLKLPEALVLRDAMQHVMAAEAVPGENNRKVLGSFYQLLNNTLKADRFLES